MLARYLRLLDAEECQRLNRLRSEAARHLFLVSHALQRCVLGALLEKDPAALVFVRTPHGKPLLGQASHPPMLDFNLSHSGTFAVLAVAPRGCDTGIDVELHRDGRRFDALAKRFFSPAERTAVARAGDSSRPGVFYDTWTLKEAWLKARGSGIRVPLADFGFCREGSRLSFSARPELETSPSDWRFWSWRLEQPASLALAIRDPGRALDEPELLHGAPLQHWSALALAPSAASDW